MKIAMIGQKGIAIGAGGVERHVEELSIRLAKEGHSVTIYYRDTFIKEDIKEYKGITLKKIKTFKLKSLDAIVYTLKATLNALNCKYDIYHYHALGPASLSFIPKIFGKKIIVSVHGLDWERDKWGSIGKTYLKFGEFITGNFADKVISVSDNLKDYFIKKYKKRNSTNTIFIPNGVNDAKHLNANLIKSYGLSSNNYILFLSRIVPEKGAHYLIQAYNSISIKDKLVIAGGSSFTDSYFNKLKILAKENKNILFTGNVAGDLLKELYSNCLFYVLPSDIEGMPLTLLEALSYGKYCLVSDIKENVDVINSNILGEKFVKSNVKDLQYKISFILKNKSYENNEKLRIEYIKVKYNWDNITNETILLYKELLIKSN